MFYCSMPLLLTRPFSKKNKINGAKIEICQQTLLMVSVAYGQGWIQGGRMRSMRPPTSHLKKCF